MTISTNSRVSASIDINLRANPAYPKDPILEDLIQDVFQAAQVLQQELSNATRFIAIASEAIAAGEYVAAYNNAGVCNIRKANATDNTKVAMAYCSSPVAAGAWGIFISMGNNYYNTGLTPGSLYYLSDAVSGAVTTVKPVGVGKIVQPIGYAISATELITNISLNFTQL